MKRDDPNGIDERTFRFFCNVCEFVEGIPEGPKTSKLIEQLVDAAGSIGSNREEACGGSSRREFIRYNEISMRSSNESARWLRACIARGYGERSKAIPLLDEARQIAKILAKIVITAKRNEGLLGPAPDAGS
jgi:four helix bundle protein